MPADIRHIVVLMMENRSFDHLLGFLNHPDPNFPGLKGTESNPDANGNPVVVSPHADYTIVPGPGHHHVDAIQQLYGATSTPPAGTVPDNSGFIANYAKVCADAKAAKDPVENQAPDVMLCLDPAKLPVFATLAKEYGVCTRWFSSVPGMTWPNRNFAHAGTSDNEVDIVKRLYTNPTVFEQLSRYNVPWAIYCDGIPQAAVYRKLWDVPFDGRDNFRSMADFESNVKKGRLPAYSFIEPVHYGPSADSMHPEYVGDREQRFVASENLIRRVYDQLSSKPEIWNHTLFIVTFDEHGGFFDREIPPEAPRPGPDARNSQHGFTFDRFGFRVPTLLISPWIKRGLLDDTLYDHASLIATVRKAFCPENAPALTGRDAAAKDVLHTLKDTTLRTDRPVLPVLPMYAPVRAAAAAAAAKEKVSLDEFQQSLVDLGDLVAKEREKTALSSAQLKSGTKAMRAAVKVKLAKPRKVGEIDAHQRQVLSLIRGEGLTGEPPAAKGRGAKAAAAPMFMPEAEVPKLSAADIRRFHQKHHAHLADPVAADKALDALLQPPAPTRGIRSAPRVRVLTEGDSWFAFPPVTGRRGVIYHLEDLRPKWGFTRLEKSGDELLGILSGQQKANLRRCFREARFDLMLFSGGGNDIVGPDFASLLRPHQPGMIWSDCVIQDRLDRRLEQLRLAYLDLLALRNDYAPGTTLIANGYDYPIPQNKGVMWLGPWMYPYLMEKGIHSGPMQRDIARHMIERFNATLAGLVNHPDAAGKFHLAPTVDTLTAQDWGDEIHPTEAGFGLIAEKFLLAIKQAGY